MKTFILSEQKGMPCEDGSIVKGRVILDDQAHGRVLQCIEAEAITKIIQTEDGPVEKVIKSAWRIAREKVDETKLYRIEGFGWYALEAA